MGRNKAGEDDVRFLMKTGSNSYTITLPVEDIRKMRWQEGQRLVVELDEKKRQFVIKDWEK